MDGLSENKNSLRDERTFDFSTSDFAIIVKTAAFVDKTLMIKDVFNCSSRILITAPPRFGKSINLNMIKRFLEIEVDKYGQPEPKTTMSNYWLFKDNNLDICKYEEFFNKHFGRYPVIYTDWKALGRMSDFASAIHIFRTIIVEAFSLHRYLLYVNKFWIDDLDLSKFEKYLCEQSIKDLDDQDLTLSFKYLSRVLYRHFKKEVYVLIDNCDGFINSTLFKKDFNSDKIISFINIAIDNLLQNNHCVGRALLTGVLPLTGERLPLHRSNICWYPFLHDHPFCKYYGLMSDELDKVLGVLERNSQERTDIKRMVVEYYNCYVSENQNVQVYNPWSVLQYLCNRKLQNSWRNYERIPNFKLTLHNSLIRNNIGQLLLGNTLQLDISRPLSLSDVSRLNIVHNRLKNISFSTVNVDTIFLFYHLGYFSVSKVLGRGFVYLKVPNEEIKYELANLFLETYCSREFVDNTKQIWSAIDSLQLNSADQNTVFETFVKTFQAWSHCPLKELDSPYSYLTRLFVSLVTIPEFRQTVVHKLGPDGPMVVQSKNKHNVAICIIAEEDTSSNPTAETRFETAKNAHAHIVNNSYKEQMFGKYDNLHGKVIITIGYSSSVDKIDLDGMTLNSNEIGFDVSIGYSYYFAEGDSLQNYRTL